MFILAIMQVIAMSTVQTECCFRDNTTSMSDKAEGNPTDQPAQPQAAGADPQPPNDPPAGEPGSNSLSKI